MFHRLSLVMLVLAFTCAGAFAQEAPSEPKNPMVMFSTTFDGSYLGVQAVDISKENILQFGLSEVRGVGIGKVMENSPAAKAGLLNNDVIIRFNGEIVSSVRKLTRLISEVAPEHSVTITVLRNGSEQKFEATLGKRDMPRAFSGDFKFEDTPPLPEIPNFYDFPKGELPNIKVMPAPRPGGFYWSSGSFRQIGVAVTTMGKQLGEFFGVSEGNGLLINDVRENSPAAKAGLRAGDVITEVDGKQVTGSFDLTRSINENQESEITLTIVRDKNRQIVKVTPDAPKEGEFKLGDRPGSLFNVNKNLNRIYLRGAEPTMSIATPAVGSAGTWRIL